MVLSKLNSKISYPELKKMYIDDLKLEADLYEIEVHGIDIIIAIGNAKKDFEDKGILFYPIYLVKSNNKVVQIGVYEIQADNLLKYLDNDNNIDVETLDEPLIFKFSTREMLEKKRLVPEKTELSKAKEQDDEQLDEAEELDEIENMGEESKKTEKMVSPSEISDVRKDIFILTEGITVPPPLREETKKIAKDIREKYKEEASDTWIQKFMQNKGYSIIDNEGGGDCLFATIRDAFSQIGQQTSVVKLRKKLADSLTQEVFMQYKNMYDMHSISLIKDTANIKDLAREYSSTREKFTQVLDREEQKQLVGGAKKIKSQHDQLVNEKKVTSEILSEFKFMKGIDTLEKFQQKIKTCDFWADTWAISTLERILNIKFIILSSENYKARSLNAVLLCGQLNDLILENKGEFKPDFYIIVDHTGTHYKLISYKRKQIFEFKELPFDIKQLVVDKCMEKNAGPFAIIPDFKKFKDDLKKKSGSVPSAINVPEEVEKFDDLSEAKMRGLYEDEVVFSVYPKSASKPLPGRGNGEKIPMEKIKDFSHLATIPEWRKKLDDFWIQPFMLDNHTWSSVEHYYQASKFKKTNPSFYLTFSLDSGTELSKDVEMAKDAGGKSGKHNKILIRPNEVKIDSDFFGGRHEKERTDAIFSKFSQNPELKDLLLSTQSAKLVKYKQAKAPELLEELMIVRDKIRRE
jgi:predicted NAD-dependent protein-ADP-ribosyltransferase YbiA (DUF1768 family)